MCVKTRRNDVADLTGIGWHLGPETFDRLGRALSPLSLSLSSAAARTLAKSPLPPYRPRYPAPASHWAPAEESTFNRTRGPSCASVSARVRSVRPWTGPVWSMPLTRTKDGEAPRLGTDVLLSRNAVVELRSGALESVRARWQTLFRASCLPFTPAIGVGWSEYEIVPLTRARIANCSDWKYGRYFPSILFAEKDSI